MHLPPNIFQTQLSGTYILSLIGSPNFRGRIYGGSHDGNGGQGLLFLHHQLTAGHFRIQVSKGDVGIRMDTLRS